MSSGKGRGALAAAVAFALAAGTVGPAGAETLRLDIAAQPVDTAIAQFARQADVQVIVAGPHAGSRRTNDVRGEYTVDRALARLLADTGLEARATGPASFAIVPTALQAGAPAPAAAPAGVREEAAGSVLDEVIVTATRQEMPLSRAPVSVAAYTRDRMDQVGVRDFVDIAARTPGVRIREPQNQIAIRGLASNAGAATTGVYIDETPIHTRTFGEGMASTLPFVFDLDRVEVLRGPQGTLYGAGSLGGAVRYITTQPSLTDTSLYGRAELATISHGSPTYEGGLAFGMPLAQDVAGLRVSASHRRRGGWVDRIRYQDGSTIEEDANTVENTVFRGAVKWQVADGLTVTPSAMYQKRLANDLNDYWEFYSDPEEGVFRNANPNRLYDDDRFALGSLLVKYEGGAFDLTANTSWFSREQVRFYDGTIYTLASYDFGYAQRLLLPSGPNAAFIRIPDFLSEGRIDNEQELLAQEIRVQSADPDARLNWLVGAYWSQAEFLNVETLIEPQLDQLLRNLGEAPIGVGADGLSYRGEQTQEETQLAGFVDVTWSFTDDFRASAGARVSRTTFESVSTMSGAYIGPAPTRSAPLEADESPWTPRFGLAYDLTASTMLYANAGKGYRTGGRNAPLSARCLQLLAAAGEPVPEGPFGSDTAWSYELGAKGTLGSRLRYEASVFRIDWTDIQQRVTLGPCGVTYTVNLGEAKSDGFDLSVAWAATDDLSVDLALGYADARFARDIFQVRGATSGALQVAAGNALFMAGTPWQGALGVRYDFGLGSLPAFVRADWEYVGDNFRQRASNDPRTNGFNARIPDRPATNFVRLRGGVEVAGTQVQLFVDNALDTTPELARFHWFRNSDLFTNSTFQPRTVGVTVTRSF